MMSIDLIPVTSGQIPSVLALFKQAAANALSGVTYLHLPSADGSGFTTKAGVFDSDLSGVVLHFGARRVALSWAQRGDLEALAIVDADTQDVSPTAEAVDVSDSDHWREVCGEALDAVSFALSEVGAGETCIVAVRFETNEGHEFVVSLGTDVDGVLEHMPDEVVVIFDSRVAASFLPDWGAPRRLRPT